jgi:hypothetical protein
VSRPVWGDDVTVRIRSPSVTGYNGVGSMSALAIWRKSRDTSGWDYSAILLDNLLVVMMDHLPGIRENSLKTWHIFTVCRIPVLAFCACP